MPLPHHLLFMSHIKDSIVIIRENMKVVKHFMFLSSRRVHPSVALAMMLNPRENEGIEF